MKPKKIKLSKRIRELNLDKNFLVNKKYDEKDSEKGNEVISDESDPDAVINANDLEFAQFDSSNEII